jgi:hypothetical protein
MGLPESPIKNLVLKNVYIDAQAGMTMQYAQVVADGLVITPAAGEAITRGPGVTIDGK